MESVYETRSPPTNKDCLFKHAKDEVQKECVFFSQGFCGHGPNCKVCGHTKVNI